MSCQTPEDAVSDDSTGCRVLMSDVKPSTMRPPATGLSPPTGAGAAGDGPHAATISIDTDNSTAGRLIEPSNRRPQAWPTHSVYAGRGKTVRSARSLAANAERRPGRRFSLVFPRARTRDRARDTRGGGDRR